LRSDAKWGSSAPTCRTDCIEDAVSMGKRLADEEDHLPQASTAVTIFVQSSASPTRAPARVMLLASARP
jgi:hypothetical protein